MKRFLLFVFDSYYPAGGWNDFAGSFDSQYDALKHVTTLRFDHYQIIDSTDAKIIDASEVKPNLTNR